MLLDRFLITTIASYTLLKLAQASTLNFNSPLSIPLAKRTLLASSDGQFNATAAYYAHMRTVRKYQGEFLRRTKGSQDSSSHQQSRKRQVERLTDQGNQSQSMTNTYLNLQSTSTAPDPQFDAPMCGLIQVGNPAQTFSIDFDTGSTDLWIPSTSCQIPVCASKNLYSPSTSKTSSKQPGTFNISYADGSHTQGDRYKDSVKLAGITVRNQSFAGASALSDSMGHDPTDGVMGLAYSTISHLKEPSVIDNAYAQGLLPSKSFAFKLAADGSELYLGGADKSKYVGQVESHSVVQKKYWEIGGASFYAGSKELGKGGYHTIIDSGTTIIYGPKYLVDKLYSTVEGSSRFDEVEGLWKFPCNNVPQVAFSWNKGKKWVIEPKQAVLGKVDDDQCVGSISSQELGLGPNTWLLGDSFMVNVYSVFDPASNTVGFAKLA